MALTVACASLGLTLSLVPAHSNRLPAMSKIKVSTTTVVSVRPGPMQSPIPRHTGSSPTTSRSSLRPTRPRRSEFFLREIHDPHDHDAGRARLLEPAFCIVLVADFFLRDDAVGGDPLRLSP
jgi:hypothetical protein